MPARLNCTGASQALHEANDGGKAYPQCGIRLAACNSVKRVPVMSLLARKPGQTTMAGTTGEKDMKVWGPINNKRATRPSGAQCTCLPQGQKQLLRLESQGTKRHLGTPVGWPRHRCHALPILRLKVFLGPFALVSGLPDFASQLKPISFPLG